VLLPHRLPPFGLHRDQTVTGRDGYPQAWVGVDPGAVWTGVVLRHGGDVLWHGTVEAPEQVTVLHAVGAGVGVTSGAKGARRTRLVGADYATAISAAIWAAWAAWISHGHTDTDVAGDLPGLAVEQVNRPQSHIGDRLRVASPGIHMALTMAATAAVMAYCGRPDRWTGLVMVPPGSNGQHPLRDYPRDLMTYGEAEHRSGLDRAAGSGNPISHQRSAWDVAGKAPHILAIRDASATPDRGALW
jgi:hypothetical protein